MVFYVNKIIMLKSIRKMKFRNEFDSLGIIKVPQDKYWGASTQRSNKHFDIGDFLVRPIVIKSIAMIKKGCSNNKCKKR